MTASIFFAVIVILNIAVFQRIVAFVLKGIILYWS